MECNLKLSHHNTNWLMRRRDIHTVDKCSKRACEEIKIRTEDLWIKAFLCKLAVPVVSE